MEKDDKGSTMIWMDVSGWMFLLVPAYPGCPGSKAVKRSLFRMDFRMERAAIITFIFFHIVCFVYYIFVHVLPSWWMNFIVIGNSWKLSKKLLAVCVCDISQQKNIGHLSSVVHFQNRYKRDRWFGMLVCCFLTVQFYRCLQLLMFKYGVASKNSTVHVIVSYLCVSWMLLLWPVRNITDLMTTGTCTTFGRSQWRFIERKKSLPSMRCAKAATRFEWKFCWRRLQVMSSDSWRLWDGVFLTFTVINSFTNISLLFDYKALQNDQISATYDILFPYVRVNVHCLYVVYQVYRLCTVSFLNVLFTFYCCLCILTVG